jgi:hypothetical protein
VRWCLLLQLQLIWHCAARRSCRRLRPLHPLLGSLSRDGVRSLGHTLVGMSSHLFLTSLPLLSVSDFVDFVSAYVPRKW